MKKLSNFGPVYVINLLDQVSRSRYIKKHFKEYGVENYHFVSAVNGKNGKQEIDLLLHPDSHTDDLRDPEIAAVLSHLKAIKHWLDTSDTPYAIICEDDVVLDTSKYWDFSWDDFLNSLNFDYDIIQMSITNPTQIPLHHRSSFKEYSAGCYLITRKYAQKLIIRHLIGDRYKIDGKRIVIVADELIYSRDKTYSVGLFTYKADESNINPDKLNGAHTRSINTTMDFWKNNSSIQSIQMK
jgi:GR25 family glycosyltransferase involved in LPS biosynthesis